jgi:hypothetical protein
MVLFLMALLIDNSEPPSLIGISVIVLKTISSLDNGLIAIIDFDFVFFLNCSFVILYFFKIFVCQSDTFIKYIS